jgi:uracil-DNA glycosylase
VNRDEAVLRELNLYPLWRLREGSSEAAGLRQDRPQGERLAASPLRGPRKQATAAPETAAAPQNTVRATEPEMIAAESAVPATAKDREQVIGELGWSELKAMVRDCTACKLRAGCTQTVFGVGDEKADWLFVGEGPGADEDALGEPFVGQAGKLLDNMLMSIKLKRGRNAYIANIVKCRPPGNRAPEPDEIATCLPYLRRQIALIKPKLIVALGKTAATSLLGRDATIASLRGKVLDYPAPATGAEETHGNESSRLPTPPHQTASPHRVGAATPLIVTYHPAYLLRTPMDKAKAWQDLCLAVETMKNLQPT